MKFYKVQSSHWVNELEFKSKLNFSKDQCFRILTHDGTKKYPTRFKVVSVSDKPTYSGTIVEILTVDTTVEKF